MPIYEYECAKCGQIIEIFQKITEKPVTKCSKCSGRVQRLISQGSFQLKGTGWYVTDYASKGKKQASDSGKDKAPSASDSGKTEKTSSSKTE